MSDSVLIDSIRTIAPESLQINLWCTGGKFQANVKERTARGWTCVTHKDPIEAVTEALRLRSLRHNSSSQINPMDML